MHDVQNLNGDQCAAVHDDEIWMAYKLMSSSDPARAKLNLRLPENINIIPQPFVEPVGRCRIDVCYVRRNAAKVVKCAIKPNDGQHAWFQRF